MAAEYVDIVAVLLGSGGAAWAGVKTSLNGLKGRQERMEGHVEKLHDKVDGLGVEVAILKSRSNGVDKSRQNP